jgi:ipoprotein LpqH
VDNRFIAGASALLVVGGVAGCSSPAPERVPPGALPAGTAEVSVNGTDLGKTDAVSCTTIGPLTTIKTGDDDAGTVSAVDNSDGLIVQSAQITNLVGFTGSYWADLGTPAKVEMTNRTFLMTGSATGFNTDNPIRTTETFSIRVACVNSEE